MTRLPALPARVVRPGEPYEGIDALRTLLRAVDDLPPSSSTANGVRARDVVGSPGLLDGTTVEALKHFQERHGLEQDGVLGPATWKALTTPLSIRLRQIELTLARWRSLPSNPYRRAIFINIPRFRLYAMTASNDQEADLLQMDVVVGRVLRELRTPTFSATLTHLVFRPYWDVPPSIARAEILPAARRDASYLERHHFELIDGAGRAVSSDDRALQELADGSLRVRQRPGDDNALGAVKFVLPNPHNVFLHDTPSRQLFLRPTRAFSHGCIRVADPAALARWLLSDQPEWTGDQIDQAMGRTEPLQVNLAEPVQVYIVYGTAVAREDGSVLFLNDLYGLDRD